MKNGCDNHLYEAVPGCNLCYEHLMGGYSALKSECKRLSEEREHYRQRMIATEINLGKMALRVEGVELQNQELWGLLESMPSGPGEGMVSTNEDSKAATEWADRYRTALARRAPVPDKPNQEGGK